MGKIQFKITKTMNRKQRNRIKLFQKKNLMLFPKKVAMYSNFSINDDESIESIELTKQYHIERLKSFALILLNKISPKNMRYEIVYIEHRLG